MPAHVPARSKSAIITCAEAARVVLCLGNYLNGGTPRGGAHGFKLDTLLKLGTLKSTDNSINLLNYIAEYLMEDDDGEQSYVIEDLSDELNKVEGASRIGMPMLMEQLAACRKGVRIGLYDKAF